MVRTMDVPDTSLSLYPVSKKQDILPNIHWDFLNINLKLSNTVIEVIENAILQFISLLVY